MRIEKDFFLDIWCQQVQIHDLRQSGTTDMADSGKLSLVGNLAALDQVIKANGQSHHLGDAGYAARRGLLWLRSGLDDGLGGTLAGFELQLVRGG